MNFREYQDHAARTRNEQKMPSMQVMISALGLVGEAGEVAEIIKKHIGHDHPDFPTRENLKKEIGDVLWYVADLATSYGLNLDEIAEQNVEKLRKRYPNGFTTADSVQRKDVKPEPDGFARSTWGGFDTVPEDVV